MEINYKAYLEYFFYASRNYITIPLIVILYVGCEFLMTYFLAQSASYDKIGEGESQF